MPLSAIDYDDMLKSLIASFRIEGIIIAPDEAQRILSKVLHELSSTKK